ncbi:MAG: murein transglycosylase domain-containing protein [Deltaproteobacteria bacterium]|nr:murein transglycosylase domain-containing protein [Deltaproteobacteria bacterium]
MANLKTLFILCVLAVFFQACTVRDAVKIAASKDPKVALKAFANSKKEIYKEDPLQALDDLQMAKNEFSKVMGKLERLAGKKWGGKEAKKLPTQKQYVKYTQNYASRAIVDFDKGIVTVETVDEKDPQKSLKNAIVTTILTPDDPRSVDLFSDKEITLTGKPYLDGLIEDNNGNPVSGPDAAEKYAGYLVAQKAETREVDNDGVKKKVLYVEFLLVSDYNEKKAAQFASTVEKHSKQYNINKSLVFAVIKTESNFNPFAVSYVPAYGLMQLVPTSGGKDAYKHVHGENEVPTKEYLFVAENNIELGTAYLNLVMYTYFEKIDNPLSREYCTIAAYNTGAGNVFKTFSGDRKDKVGAINKINSMTPQEVFEKMKKDLPFEETRHYIVKVTDSQKKFVKM